VQTVETFKAIREFLTCWLLLKNFVVTSNRLFFYDGLLITFVRGKTDHQYRGGQLIWLMGHFEKVTYSGGLYLVIAIEASLGSSLMSWRIFQI